MLPGKHVLAPVCLLAAAMLAQGLDAFEALAPRVAEGELALLAIGARSVLERTALRQGRRIELEDETKTGAFPRVPLAEVAELRELAARHQVRIVGLHAHPGSGIFDVASWADTAALLLEVAHQLPEVRCIDLGGGLGVSDSQQRAGVDLQQLGTALRAVRERRSEIEFWLEPGRYFVAAAGVLLARVTQTKTKDDNRFVGVATGMNSLIRPALYGAWHDIVNLTRLDAPATEVVNVVGPICESADFLGHDRLLPPTAEGDVLLIANAGAYGRAMSSHYNLREPAPEIIV